MLTKVLPVLSSDSIIAGLSFEPNVFDDAKMPIALLDRFTHHCHIVETRNDPRRFRNGTGELAKRPPPKEFLEASTLPARRGLRRSIRSLKRKRSIVGNASTGCFKRATAPEAA
ncbi:ATP-binding protein [Paraburkholderia aspalathi]|uniref:ATP-binding protein n=1 Tax=Paraburkholderia aspalathi TaxID=1324617 RepID=UPI003557C649